MYLFQNQQGYENAIKRLIYINILKKKLIVGLNSYEDGAFFDKSVNIRNLIVIPET